MWPSSSTNRSVLDRRQPGVGSRGSHGLRLASPIAQAPSVRQALASGASALTAAPDDPRQRRVARPPGRTGGSPAAGTTVSFDPLSSQGILTALVMDRMAHARGGQLTPTPSKPLRPRNVVCSSDRRNQADNCPVSRDAAPRLSRRTDRASAWATRHDCFCPRGRGPDDSNGDVPREEAGRLARGVDGFFQFLAAGRTASQRARRLVGIADAVGPVREKR